MKSPILLAAVALTFPAAGLLAQDPPAPPPLPPHEEVPMVDLSWYRNVQDRADQDPDLAVAVAISGGGHRAANYAVGVLLGLEKVPYGTSNLLNEVDYFSTVSSGGFAAALYLSERFAHGAEYRPSDRFFEEALAENCPDAPDGGRHSDRCSLHGVQRGYYSLLRRIRGIGFGKGLEDTFNARLLGLAKHPEAFAARPSGLTLGDIFVPHFGAEPRLPYWVINATIYRNGAIFSFTPDVLRAYAVAQHVRGSEVVAVPEPEGFPLAAALKASASFPVAIPGSILGTAQDSPDRFLRLIDGGLADNLGMLTATHLLCQDRAGARSKGVRRKVLLVIDAFPGDGSPYEERWNSAPAFATLIRTARISLDSWHSRHRQFVEVMSRQCGFTPIFLSFEGLVQDGAPDLAPEESTSCSRITGIEDSALLAEALSGSSRMAERARRIKTRLKIAPRDQGMLHLAGRLGVCLVQRRLLDAAGERGYVAPLLASPAAPRRNGHLQPVAEAANGNPPSHPNEP